MSRWFALSIFVAALCAQLDTATFLGAILDSSGASVPGAHIAIQNTATAASWSRDSGANLNAPVNFGRSLGTIAALGGFATNRQIQFALRWGF